MPLLTYPKFQTPKLDGTNLSGGKVNFYEVGTTTRKTTWSNAILSAENDNPVVLDARGEADIFLSGAYKIILTGADDVEIWTIANHSAQTTSQWIPAVTSTYVSSTSFTIATNLTLDYEADRRIKLNDSTTLSGVITSSSYSSPNTTVIVNLDSGSLSASLSTSELSILTVTNPAIPESLGKTKFTGTLYEKKGADIDSANDLVLLADGNSNAITGTTTVNGMTDGVQNERRHFRAGGAFILKHNTAPSSGFSKFFIVEGAADITAKADDEWDAIYDGTVWRIVNYVFSSGIKEIQSITGTVASSALTCGLKSNRFNFRSATLTDGAPTLLSFGDLSLVVPSTATLGCVSAVQSRLILLAINNAGAVEPAIVNQSGGVNLDETTLISTTALSTGSDSDTVIYSTTARSNVAFRVVGYIESTQSTAGTWDTSPSTLQGAGGNALTSMNSLGRGQTWQDVSGSRSISTTYYNTTGKAIYVHLKGVVNGANIRPLLTIDSMALQGTSGYANTATVSIQGVIPPGSSYALTITSGALSSIEWLELR